MSVLRALFLLASVAATPAPLEAAPPGLVEGKIGGETLRGKIVARSPSSLWLLGQDGSLRPLPADDAPRLHQISPRFSGWTGSILREQLRNEFGKSFDVVGTRHYVVCARGEKKARSYAETFEELFRTFQMYFSVRGFKINEPEFPLVAIVFPDYESFARYAQAGKISATKTLKGYYLTTSNRVALYEEPGIAAAKVSWPPAPADLFTRDLAARAEFPLPAFAERPPAWGAIEASLKDTMIHEATHQAAFNTGLHSRIGQSPKWIVEGLATVFEAPGVRSSASNSPLKMRINRDRFLWFGNYVKARRQPKSLESFLAGDDLFKSSVLDAYSEAWALSFFLIETRPRAYAAYLRTIAARNPLLIYPADERLTDFKKTVSNELPLLEAEFLRFIAAINPSR